MTGFRKIKGHLGVLRFSMRLRLQCQGENSIKNYMANMQCTFTNNWSMTKVLWCSFVTDLKVVCITWLCGCSNEITSVEMDIMLYFIWEFMVGQIVLKTIRVGESPTRCYDSTKRDISPHLCLFLVGITYYGLLLM